MADRDAPLFDPFEFQLNSADVTVGGFCCIQIPTSLIPYITGALEPLRFPMAWYGENGDVTRAMRIFSTLIAELGAMITACQNQNSTPSSGESEDCMSGNCGPTPPVKIDNGRLYYWWCCEWVEIGNLTLDAPLTPDDNVVEPEVPEEQVNLACLKARVIGEMVWDLVKTIPDTIDDTLPIFWVPEIQKRYGVDLYDKFVVAAIGSLVTGGIMELVGEQYSIIPDYMSVFSTYSKEKYICHLAQNLSGETSAIVQADLETIMMSLQVLLLAHVGVAYIANCILAIGIADFDRATRAAALDSREYDCSCPEEQPVVPEGMDWAHFYDFRLDQYDWVIDSQDGEWQMGVGFVNEIVQYANLPQASKNSEFAGTDDAQWRYWRATVQWPVSSGYADACMVRVQGQGNVAIEPYIGMPIVSGSVNSPFPDGAIFRCFRGQSGDPNASGTAILKTLLIAGTGDDPFPNDAPYP